MKKVLVIFISFCCSCSMDDSENGPFSPPQFIRGDWGTEVQLVGGDFTWKYTFTRNNIIEDACGIRNDFCFLDYKSEFDNPDVEITEIKEEGYYRVDIKSTSAEGIDFVNGNTEFFIAFRKGIVNGDEVLLLDYQGTAGVYMRRL